MEEQILKEFDSAVVDPSVREDRLVGMHAVKLYHCHIGRNAWHSTWVRIYSDGCMHLTEGSAQSYAETLRNRGNVVYIEELPALCFSGRRHLLLVTQLNTETPLLGYSARTPRHRRADRGRRSLFSFGMS